MKVSPLFNEAAAQLGANLMVEIEAGGSAKDLAAGTVAATALTLNPFTIHGPYQLIDLISAEIVTPFQDEADAANNSTLVEAGYTGSTAASLASTQINLNGAFVPMTAGTGTKVTPAADTLIAVKFTPPAGKTLAALTKGRLRLLYRLRDSRPI